MLSLLLYFSRYYFLTQRRLRTAAEFFLLERQPRGCDPLYAIARAPGSSTRMRTETTRAM